MCIKRAQQANISFQGKDCMIRHRCIDAYHIEIPDDIAVAALSARFVICVGIDFLDIHVCISTTPGIDYRLPGKITNISRYDSGCLQVYRKFTLRYRIASDVLHISKFHDTISAACQHKCHIAGKSTQLYPRIQRAFVLNFSIKMFSIFRDRAPSFFY